MIEKLWDNRGITVVELMIAAAIMLITLSLGFSLFFFGSNSFDEGTSQANLQQTARLIDEYMRSDLRNVGELIIAGSDYDGDYAGSFTIQNDAFISQGSIITEPIVNYIKLKVDTTDDSSLLIYEINCSDGDREYTLNNQLFLNNMPLVDAALDEYISLSIENELILYYKDATIFANIPDQENNGDETGEEDEDNGDGDIDLPVIEINSLNNDKTGYKKDEYLQVNFNQNVIITGHSMYEKHGNIFNENNKLHADQYIDKNQQVFEFVFNPKLKNEDELHLSVLPSTGSGNTVTLVIRFHGNQWK